MSEVALIEEIAEQPAVVERLLESQSGEIERAAALARSAGVQAVLIAARGSSDNVARYAQHVLGRFCGLPVALASPSLMTLYGGGPRLERTLVIGISQSGQSPDVNAVLQDARDQGQPTLALTNDPGSPLAGTAEVTIDIAAGAERSVAATKTYTASLAAIAALCAALADERALRSELNGIAGAMQAQLDRGIGDASGPLGTMARCAVAGRGPNYATAFEAALKVKELTGIAAEPYSPADLMHGPVAVLGVDSPLLAIGVAGPALESVTDAASAAEQRGARCLAITDSPRSFPAAEVIHLSRVPEWLSPLVAILPAQVLAAELALRRGVTLDTPFGLSKVTRTV